MQGRHPVAVLHLHVPANEVDVNVHPTKREVRLRHSMARSERLERAIAHTLATSPTQPDSSGELQELQGLAQSDQNQPIQELLAPIEQDDRGAQPVTAPPWALAAGTQLNLVGEVAEETVDHTEKPRPQSIAASAQKSLPGLSKHRLHPLCRMKSVICIDTLGVEGVFHQPQNLHSLVLKMTCPQWNPCRNLQIHTSWHKPVKSCC